jgi:hypothetical protein
VTAEESLARAEALLERLEATRARLETTDDKETAIELLGELAQMARDVQAELEQAQRESDALS